MSSIAFAHVAPRRPVTGAPVGRAAVGSHLRITRRGRAVLTALAAIPLVVIAVMMGLNAGQAAAGDQTPQVSFQHVTVTAGDSLWSIAERIAPNSDPRDVVAAIEELNGLSDSNVGAGQSLAIPTRYSETN